MALYVKINLNDYVRCKLTETGKALLKRNHEELNEAIVARGGRPLKDYEDKPDADGYLNCQLWALMQTFGPHMIMGAESPIELDIVCEVSDFKDL